MLNSLQVQFSTFCFKQEHNKNNRLIQEYVKLCLAVKARVDFPDLTRYMKGIMSSSLFRYPFKFVYSRNGKIFVILMLYFSSFSKRYQKLNTAPEIAINN